MSSHLSLLAPCGMTVGPASGVTLEPNIIAGDVSRTPSPGSFFCQPRFTPGADAAVPAPSRSRLAAPWQQGAGSRRLPSPAATVPRHPPRPATWRKLQGSSCLLPAQHTAGPHSLPCSKCKPSAISHPELPCTNQAERAPRAPSKPTCVCDDSHDLGTRSRKQGNLLCRGPSLRHMSRDEMLQLAVTRGDENTGTKSRGLFSTWASAFEHLNCLVIKCLFWQKRDV